MTLTPLTQISGSVPTPIIMRIITLKMKTHQQKKIQGIGVISKNSRHNQHFY